MEISITIRDKDNEFIDPPVFTKVADAIEWLEMMQELEEKDNLSENIPV